MDSLPLLRKICIVMVEPTHIVYAMIVKILKLFKPETTSRNLLMRGSNLGYSYWSNNGDINEEAPMPPPSDDMTSNDHDCDTTTPSDDHTDAYMVEEPIPDMEDILCDYDDKYTYILYENLFGITKATKNPMFPWCKEKFTVLHTKNVQNVSFFLSFLLTFMDKYNNILDSWLLFVFSINFLEMQKIRLFACLTSLFSSGRIFTGNTWNFFLNLHELRRCPAKGGTWPKSNRPI